MSVYITAYTMIYRNNRFRCPLPIYGCSERERKRVIYVCLFLVFFCQTHHSL